MTVIIHQVLQFCVAHPDIGVNLLLQVSNLSKVLPDSLLQMQDAAALLLRVARNFQLEADTLLLLTVLLNISQRMEKIQQLMTSKKKDFVIGGHYLANACAYLAPGLHV